MHPRFSIRFAFIAVVVFIAGATYAQTSPVNGTTGTPLGGFGAGGVKFNANDGTFAAMTRPPADAYDFQPVAGAQFELSVTRGSKTQSVAPLKAATVDGLADDDAIWPIHRVNFGVINGVQARMTAFSPLARVNSAKISLPCVLYEITLTNTGTSDVTVDCTLKWDNSNTWAISNNNTTLSLIPGEKEACQFVLAWHSTIDPEISHYLSRYDNPKAIAEQGMSHFDELKTTAESLVNRMRASNLPEWLKNQTLNTLANFTTNSMYKKDGRVGFAEGQWTCFGTMDQMWHARQIVNQTLPYFAWQELEYWARTQRKDGQIHHDFNLMDGGKDTFTRSVLVGWDDTEHKDYRNIDKWVDLNCAFIVSVFETYRSTGDQSRFDFHWPHVKKAAQRILDQVNAYGNKDYPYTFDDSENSYDAGGEPDPFNAGFSAVAYKIMVELAREKGENDLAATYQKAYDTVVESFRNRYLKNTLKLGKHSESIFAAQWLAIHLKLGEIWTETETDQILHQLDSYYHPYYWGLGSPAGTYDEWTPYILSHYGGLLLNTRRANQWYALQHDSYSRQYEDRNRVFNHPLDILPKVAKPKPTATDIRSKKQYISLPVLWRNYYDIVGYHRDARTRALWLTPILLDEKNPHLTDALYLSPEGDGTISCTFSGTQFQNQVITFKPDRPIEVRALHLADRFGAQVSVNINGQDCSFKRIGTGYARELVADWSGTVGHDGLRVTVTGDAGSAAPSVPEKPADVPQTVASQGPIDAFAGMRAARAAKFAGISVVNGYVESCNNFDYIQFEQVDFGKVGAAGFVAKVKGLARDVSVEIVLDSVSGETIGTCPVPAPAEAAEWIEVKCPTKKTTGVHDVFLRFSGSSPDDLMHLDSFKFTKVTAAK